MKHILLIEDNEEMSENTAEILELSSYMVSTAANGKEGVQKALDLSPDLILCDIMMPEMDGYGVVHALNNNPSTASIPFIFLTAKVEKADLRKGMELGADDYLTKPYTGLELLTAVETRLKKSTQNQDSSVSSVNKTAEEDILKRVRILIDENTFTKKYFKKKEIVYTEGALPYHVYYINSGLIRTNIAMYNGKEVITELITKNNLFGYKEALSDTPYTNYAVAVENTELILLPKDILLQELAKDPGLHLNLERSLANRINQLENKLFLTAYMGVKKRVATTLVELSDIYSNTLDSELIQLSREDLANYIGVSPETVIRTLSEFKDKGLISIETGKIRVIEKEHLLKLRH